LDSRKSCNYEGTKKQRIRNEKIAMKDGRKEGRKKGR